MHSQPRPESLPAWCYNCHGGTHVDLHGILKTPPKLVTTSTKSYAGICRNKAELIPPRCYEAADSSDQRVRVDLPLRHGQSLLRLYSQGPLMSP